MELTGERLLPADQASAWSALTDVDTLRQCIPGAETIVALDGNRYEIVMTAAIGPVRARFKGTLEMADIAAPESYTLKFDGSGGQAGFVRGQAAVKLSPAGAQQTTLAYSAQAQVGGRLAQVGSRIVDAAAAATADRFFEAFGAQLAARAALRAAEAPAQPGLWSLLVAFVRRLFRR